MKMPLVLLWAVMGAVASAQPPSAQQAVQALLQEARERRLVVVVEQPTPKGTTPIPQEDQLPEEEEDPGAAVPS